MILESLEKLHSPNKGIREKGILEVITISSRAKKGKELSVEGKSGLLKKLINGLGAMKISVRETYFVALTNFLRANRVFEENWLMDTLEMQTSNMLKDSKKSLKSRAKDVRTMRILGMGALIKSDSIKNEENIASIFEKLYQFSKKCTSNMASNFVCLLLSKANDKLTKRLLKKMINEVEYVREKSNGLVCINLEFLCIKLGIVGPFNIINDVELLVKILSVEFKGGVNPLIQTIFSHLSENKLFTPFWEMVNEKYLHFEITALKYLLTLAIGNQKCPRNVLITFTLTLLDSAIFEHRELGKEMAQKTLVWDEYYEKHKKRKTEFLNILFGPEGFLIHYKILSQLYKMLLKKIAKSHAENVVKIVELCRGNIEDGCVIQSSLTILYWVLVDPDFGVELPLKLEILKSEFLSPFLSEDVELTEEPEDEGEDSENKRKINTSEFLRNIYSTSSDFNLLVEGFDAFPEINPNFLSLFPSIEPLWKKGMRALGKAPNEFVQLLKLCLMRLLFLPSEEEAKPNQKNDIKIIERIIESALTSTKSDDHIGIIIKLVLEEKILESPFFNVEMYFKSLQLNRGHLELLSQGLHDEYEEMPVSEPEAEEMQSDDDQSSIDLDQASEASLKKLDRILAMCVARKTGNTTNPKYIRSKRILQIIENCFIHSRDHNLLPAFLLPVLQHFVDDGTPELESKLCHKFLQKILKFKRNPKFGFEVKEDEILKIAQEILALNVEIQDELDDSDEDDDDDMEDVSEKKSGIKVGNKDERCEVLEQSLRMLSRCFADIPHPQKTSKLQEFFKENLQSQKLIEIREEEGSGRESGEEEDLNESSYEEEEEETEEVEEEEQVEKTPKNKKTGKNKRASTNENNKFSPPSKRLRSNNKI